MYRNEGKNLENKINKKRIIKILFGLFFALAIIIAFNVATIIIQTNHSLQKDYTHEMTKNSQSTQEFIKAMKYKIYISKLHKYVSYDNFLMKPFFQKMDYHFNKGKENLPKESIDDIIWWCLLYDEIYGLVYNDDKSMQYTNLNSEKLQILIDEIYEMVGRLPYGNLENFQMQDSLLEIMLNLSDFYFNAMFEKYERSCIDKNDCSGKKLYYLDKNNSHKHEKIYVYLKDGYDRYIQNSAMQNIIKSKYNQKLLEIINFKFNETQNERNKNE